MPDGLNEKPAPTSVETLATMLAFLLIQSQTTPLSSANIIEVTGVTRVTDRVRYRVHVPSVAPAPVCFPSCQILTCPRVTGAATSPVDECGIAAGSVRIGSQLHQELGCYD